MNTFYLKVGKETINQVRAEDINEAIEYFSKIKRMEKSELLRIFKIDFK